MYKKITLTTLLIVLIITGCNNEPETAKETNAKAKARFEQNDKKIGEFLDQLDNPNTSQEVRIQILCKDYPEFYKKEYMPAFLQLTKDYTEEKMMYDLKTALDYYKSKFNISCKVDGHN